MRRFQNDKKPDIFETSLKRLVFPYSGKEFLVTFPRRS